MPDDDILDAIEFAIWGIANDIERDAKRRTPGTPSWRGVRDHRVALRREENAEAMPMRIPGVPR